MKIPRIYLDEPELAAGREFTLPRDQAKYLTRVLRRGSGDAVLLFNGDGYNYTADLTAAANKVAVSITAKAKNDTESPLSITLVQALAKGTKLDLVIQKATELGVDKIVPVVAERSIMQIDTGRLQNKLAHWHGVAVSASTQCGRSTLPQIEPPGNLPDWFARSAADGLVLHPCGSHPISEVSISRNCCTLFVGPEGGFTDQEISSAVTHGLSIVSCGPRILRTETAGFTAVSVLQSRFGDL